MGFKWCVVGDCRLSSAFPTMLTELLNLELANRRTKVHSLFFLAVFFVFIRTSIILLSHMMYS